MRTGLLMLAGAVLAATALPAQAQHSATITSSGTSASEAGERVRVHRGSEGHRRDWDRRWRGTDGHWRGRNDVIVYDNGLWALYNNRSWESDSYNDWFQDQPNRSLPRWVQKNGDCKRVYWSGGGWTC